VPSATEQLLCRGDVLTFTPDGGAVATATTSGVVTWDFRTGRERPRLPVAGGAYEVVFAGPYALTWAQGSLALWRTDLPAPADDGPREPLLTLPVESTALSVLRLDPADGVLRYEEDGRTVGVHTLSLHGLTGRTWREKAAGRAAFDAYGRPARPRRASVRGAEAVVVDPAGRTALTGEGLLVDLATGRKRTAVTGEDLLTAGAMSADGRHLATADYRGRLTLWDLRARHRIAVLRATGSTADRLALAFSQDGSLLAVGAPDGSVQVWETAQPHLGPATLPAGDGPVLAVGFGPDGTELHLATPHLPDRRGALAPDRAAAEVCSRANGGATKAEWRRYLPSVPYRGTCAA
jgi:hypothetical protein